MQVAEIDIESEFCGAPLGTVANKVAKGNVFGTQIRQENRTRIFTLRFTSQAILKDLKNRKGKQARICHCGKTPTELTCYVPGVGRLSTDVTPTIKKNDGGIYFSGLQTCGSVWVCPICSLKISQYRKMEVFKITAAMNRRPGVNSGQMVITLRHDKGDSLRTVKKILLKSWQKVQVQREYRELCKKYKHLGDVRALEVKVSMRSGWHPHLHILMFAESSPEDMEAFANAILKLYCRKNERAAMEGQYYKGIFNEQDIEDYITKWQVSDELTMGNSKTGGKEKDSYMPFDLLTDVQINTRWKIAKFREYAETMAGTRQLTFSKEVRKLREEMKIKEDEEIVREEQAAEEMLAIDVPVWQKIAENWLQPHVLNEFENGGVAFVQRLLNDYGINTFYDTEANILTLEPSG
jgi:Replication protein